MRLVVAIPGLAYKVASEGNPGRSATEALKGAQIVKSGVGYQAVLSLTPKQADELLSYFGSRLTAPRDMTFPEYRAGNIQIAARQAARRIEAAIQQART